MDANLASHEAPHAREEINKTNRTTMDGMKYAIWAPSVFYVLYLLYGHWQFLILAIWANEPMLSLLIRAETLVRRHWSLWILKTQEPLINPDQISRNFILVANIKGLLWNVAVIVLVSDSYWGIPTGPMIADVMYFTGIVLFVVGILLSAFAGLYQPTFGYKRQFYRFIAKHTDIPLKDIGESTLIDRGLAEAFGKKVGKPLTIHEMHTQVPVGNTLRLLDES